MERRIRIREISKDTFLEVMESIKAHNEWIRFPINPDTVNDECVHLGLMMDRVSVLIGDDQWMVERSGNKFYKYKYI